MKILIVGILYQSVQTYAKENWQRIYTPHYDIIFLDEMSLEAQRMANTLETLYLPTSKTLQTFPSRIPIILHSRIAESNGFVTLVPSRKSVLYSFPMHKAWFLLNNDWLNMLAIHELRHVAQYEHQLSTYNLVDLSFLLADNMWLHEGDAVGIETALSAGGRGKSPYFSLLYKVNLLERGGFSYYKQMIGSLQHQIPNHYHLGYFMTTYLRRKYGGDIIRQLMLRDGFVEHINLFTFYNRVKKLTGKTISQIYRDANSELKHIWEGQLQGLKITASQPISRRKSEEYTDYTYPQPVQGGVMVLKSGLAVPPQFVKIDQQGNEAVLCTPAGITAEEKFSVVQNKIIWTQHTAEYSFNDKKSSSTIIQSYNLITKKFATIGIPNRYHVASLSPDGTKVAVCVTDESYNHSLKILHAETGKILQQFSTPENHYYLTPSWSTDGKELVMITHACNQATISCINLLTGTIQDIIPYTTEAINEPILKGEYIYYSSPYSGIDNIYAVHIQTKQRFQVTSSKYGAYHPALSEDGKWLLYNDYSKDGMDVVQAPINPKEWIPITEVQDRSIHYYQPLVAQENNADVLTKIPNKIYPILPHRIWKNLALRLKHSYQPLLNGSVEAVLYDLLGKVAWTLAGYQHNSLSDVSLHRFFTQFTYQAWKPIITSDLSLLRVQQKNQKSNYSKKASLFMQLPFIWYQGEYTNKISLGTKSQVNIWSTPTKWYFTQNYTAKWSRKSPKSIQDIQSPWGQALKVNYTHAWNRSTIQGFQAQLSLYFPSLWRHHSIRTGIAYQYQQGLLPFVEKQALLLHPLFYSKDHQLGFCIDYWFPIAYPDWEPMLYVLIKRLGTNLVYDYSYDIRYKEPHHSIGAGFTMDVSWLHVRLNFMYKFTTDELGFSIS